MVYRRAPRFIIHVALLLVILGTVQLAASLLFYQAIDRQTLRNDHARRVAELLVASDRVHAVAPERTAATMSTRHLRASVDDAPAAVGPAANTALVEIAREIVSWEPSLSGRDLRLAVQDETTGRRDLVGSIRLADGQWLNFRSLDIASMWPVASRATAITLASAAAGMFIGLVVLHLLGRPLRQLTVAAEAIGHGRTIAIREEGPPDLRDLARAMNTMQARVAGLLRDQARSFEAISHDLRTPLSRQKITAELIEEQDLAAIVLGSVDEMENLLASLQTFLRAQQLTCDPDEIDLAELVRGIAEPFGHRITIIARDVATVTTFPECLRLAVAALIENAMQFAGKATVTIAHPHRDRCEIAIEDDGPGIDPRHFDDILDPFFRLDAARSRDTRGFGLGIPTAHLLMMRFNGSLSFERAEGGGLIARLTVPRP